MIRSVEKDTSNPRAGTWFVAYDVQVDGRRQRLAALLGSHGERVQRSVFIVWVSPEQMPVLSEQVESLISTDTDSVIFIPLPKITADGVLELGQASVPEQQLCWVV